MPQLDVAPQGSGPGARATMWQGRTSTLGSDAGGSPLLSGRSVGVKGISSPPRLTGSRIKCGRHGMRLPRGVGVRPGDARPL